MTLSELYAAAAIGKDYEAAEDRITMLTNPATQVPPVDIITPAGTEGGTAKIRIDADKVRNALVSDAMIESANHQTSLASYGIVVPHDNYQAPAAAPVVNAPPLAAAA